MISITGSALELVNSIIEDAPSIPCFEDYEKYRITDLTDIPFPTPIVQIGGEVISTPENITVISGESKSGKSALGSMIISGALSSDAHNLEQLEVAQNIGNKAIIHIDTEQARHRQQGNVKSILKRANLATCPDHYLSYNIRQMDLADYERVTSSICELCSEKFGGVFLIFIDGMADYITSVNDEEQAARIVKFFEGLSILHQCPLITVVHTNPGGNKERGHLGSHLQRKAESVLMVVSDEDCSYIQPKYLRNAGKANVPQIQFKYDDFYGYHIDCGVKENNRVTNADRKKVLLEVAVSTIFSERKGSAISYGDLIQEICVKTRKSPRTAKDYKVEMEAYNLIMQNTDGLYIKTEKTVNNDPF